jgi:hypothetical protein
MSHILIQIPVNCGNCGEFLFKVHRSTAVIGVGSETREDEPTCSCEGVRFLMLLKAAEKIVPLTAVEQKYHSPSEFGEKVEDAVGRHKAEVPPFEEGDIADKTNTGRSST